MYRIAITTIITTFTAVLFLGMVFILAQAFGPVIIERLRR